MATEAVTLPEISVGPADQAPDSPALPSSTYANPSVNYNASTGKGAFTTSGVQEQNTAPTSTNNQEQTPDVQNTLSNGDLPWAKVLLPTTSAGQGGLGEGRHGLKPESYVYGIFLDGDACQQPLILGVIPRGPGGGFGGSGDGTGGSSGGSSGSVDTSNINTNVSGGGDNAMKCAKILVQNGYSAQNAAGIIGNLLAEGAVGGGDINPTQREIGKPNAGYGIAQWTTPSRKEGLRRVAGSQYNTIEGQTRYLIYELRTSEKTAARLLENARNDVAASTIAFFCFERPLKGWDKQKARDNGGNGVVVNSSNVQNRIAKAQAFYKKFMSQSASSPTPTQTPAATATRNTPSTTFANQPAPSFTPATNTPTS